MIKNYQHFSHIHIKAHSKNTALWWWWWWWCNQ